jgi:lysophospholipase L1-like esterase
MLILGSCNPVQHYVREESVLSWEEDIRHFDSLNAIEFSDEQTLLVTGSSSVRLWDSIHADLAPYRVVQRGYGGASLPDFNYYIGRIVRPHPYKAILVFVANDITGEGRDKTPREVFGLCKMLLKQIHEISPASPVYWIEVTPTPERWLVVDQIREASALIRHYCEREEGLYFIDTYDYFIGADGEPDPGWFRSDSLHLSREGYLLWSSIILDALEKNL